MIQDLGTNRRSFLVGAGACMCTALSHHASARSASPTAPWRIDVHRHYGAPAHAAFTAANPTADLPPFPSRVVEAALADMDQGGTALSVLSSLVPESGGTVAERAALARAVNEYGAEIVQRNPKRFALFAVLPLPDVDGCLKELAYGLDRLGAVGVTMSTEAGGKYLGDPAFEPLLDELNRRRAVVFVHPLSGPCCRDILPNVPDPVIEFGTSTTRCIASLVFGGAVDRYPHIRFIFSHGGGTMPFLIERFMGGTQAEIVPGIMTDGGKRPLNQPKGGALAALRRFHYDTAQIANPVALNALKQVVSASQIVYGTDAWFRTASDTTRGIETARVFTEAEQRAIGLSNALALMPSLAKRLDAA